MTQHFWRTGLSGVLVRVVFSQFAGLTFYEIGVCSGILFKPAYQQGRLQDTFTGVQKLAAFKPAPMRGRAPYRRPSVMTFRSGSYRRC